MKSLNIKFPFTHNDLLNYFRYLNTKDLQSLVDQLTKIISTRKDQSPEEQEAYLVSIIETPLPEAFLLRFQELQVKMENASITATELLEMQAYTERIEEFDTEKMNALFELAELRKVPFQQLAQELNAFPKTNE